MLLGRRSSSDLEKRLGYRFKRRDLLELALVHRSWAAEQGSPEHYERLEFLGDSVLGLVASEWLYRRHPELPEGELSKMKAQVVSRPTLARHAEALGIGDHLKLGVGEERSGGRRKDSLLSDAMEALFGAIYLDSGLEPARTAILAMLDGVSIERIRRPGADPKTRLQEVSQALGWDLPTYRIASESGPDHSKVFTVECLLRGELAGRGEGPSKKAAEQAAAADALERLPEDVGFER